MAKKKGQTASFMVRFNQNIFENEKGESDVQWRGQISHVQDGDKVNFAEIKDALDFMQEKLAALTIDATEDKTPEEQEGILTKSFDMWKKMTASYPKLVMDAIKDPKAQIAQLQGQIQSQISTVGGEISQKIENTSWRAVTKSDLDQLTEKIEKMSKELGKLNKKVTKLGKS